MFIDFKPKLSKGHQFFYIFWRFQRPSSNESGTSGFTPLLAIGKTIPNSRGGHKLWYWSLKEFNIGDLRFQLNYAPHYYTTLDEQWIAKSIKEHDANIDLHAEIKLGGNGLEVIVNSAEADHE